jgi:intermediate filament protein if
MENVDKADNESTSTTTKTTTTTTYETRSYETEPNIPVYKAQLAPRHIVINRTSFGSGPSGGATGGGRRSVSMERSIQYGSSMAAPPGAYALVTSTGVTAVKSSREKEKKDMQDLNERFAGYIEKVRFLEAQNRRLADELEKLKARWGKETSQIKAMYQAELDEARRLLDDGEKEKARLEIRVASLEEQLQEMKQKLDDAYKSLTECKETIEKNNQQLADNDGELSLLRRRLASLESDRDKDKKLILQLQDSLNRARIDLDNETLLHIDAENRRQTLEEELEFLKTVHEQEMKELSALAYRDTTAENREFWKNEMGQALREIQQIYDEKLDAMKGEMETFYNLKLQEFRTGATRQSMETEHAKEEIRRLRTQMAEIRDKFADLETKNAQLQRELDALRREKEDRERELENENMELKGEVAKLRAEMEAIMKELQDIMDTKLGLELEIAAYRKLLEGEESRIGLRQVVDTLSSGGHAEGSEDSTTSKVGHFVRTELSSRTTYQKSAKGPVLISECSADGKFIVLENTGRKDEALGGWTLKRTVDGVDKVDHTLDHNLVIKPGNRIKIWASGAKPLDALPTDIETSESDWGTGANITTKLINTAGEERATHVQKTSS